MRAGSVSERTTEEAEAYAGFVAGYPSYTRTLAIDDLRLREFARLDRLGQVYVDYTGGSLYAESQVHRHEELLRTHIFGNPHSSNPASSYATEQIEAARRRVLAELNAPADEYAVIFTANATQALKLVGESYPFRSDSTLLLTFDNHNSVNGIREFARARGTQTAYLPIKPPDLRADDRHVAGALRTYEDDGPRLFAFPAQSNFSGVQHPLRWIGLAHAAGWDVLLDAAAFAPTNELDLGRWRPDFVAISFYKIFGYPTGIGALIARRSVLDRLHRPWFAGGTINVASVQADRYVLADTPAAYEEGTLNYLEIPAVPIGFDLLATVGRRTVHERVQCLTAWVIANLLALRHDTGASLIRLYGPASADARGGTVAFNIQDRDGRVIDHRQVEALAPQSGISLRTGCFCNPGAGEAALGLPKRDLIRCLDDPHATYDSFRQCMTMNAVGAVRASFGLVSNFHDAWRLREFVRTFLG